MPRVSQTHLAARRRQILDAARTCFIRNGFHTTSMQDVVREAGVSVGAVYRYFPSKNELIRAIAEDALGGRLDMIDKIAAADPLPPLVQVMDEVLRVLEDETGPDGALRIAVQVWGESLRDPDLAKIVATTYRTLRSRFVTLAEYARASGQLPDDTDPAHVGSVLFGLAVGYLVQVILVGPLDRPSYLAGMAAMVNSTIPDPAHR